MPSKHQGMRIGHAPSGDVLRHGRPGHLIKPIAPTRVGKSRDVLIPALLDFPHSCIVVDPKGDTAIADENALKKAGLT
jgi:type IV secretory pathway TraG/TraD family ATPase VirD4